jgi:HK97 family phage major capsid protein
MRARAVLVQAGAVTVPMDAATLKIARVTADPTIEWLAENASQTDSQPTLDSVTLSAKTLRCLVKASRELVEDAPNFNQIFESMLADAFASEVDRVGLVGSGGAQPSGLFGTSGISTVSMGTNGAALTNYDPFVDVLAALWGANVPQVTGLIYAPRTAGSIAKLKATDNQPLQAPAEVAAVPRFITSGIPINQTQGSASNASCALSGNFGDCLIGVRHGFTLEAYPGPGAANFQIHFLAHLRVDFAFARPAAFARIIGIIP